MQKVTLVIYRCTGAVRVLSTLSTLRTQYCTVCTVLAVPYTVRTSTGALRPVVLYSYSTELRIPRIPIFRTSIPVLGTSTVPVDLTQILYSSTSSLKVWVTSRRVPVRVHEYLAIPSCDSTSILHSTSTISSIWIEKVENRPRIAQWGSTKIFHTFFSWELYN